MHTPNIGSNPDELCLGVVRKLEEYREKEGIERETYRLGRGRPLTREEGQRACVLFSRTALTLITER
jgi:hypothetical protein